MDIELTPNHNLAETTTLVEPHEDKLTELNKSNFFSTHLSPKISGFAEKRPLVAVAIGIGATIASIIGGAVLSVTIGPVGSVAFLGIPIGVAMIIRGHHFASKPIKIDPINNTPKNPTKTLRLIVDHAFENLSSLLLKQYLALPKITDSLATAYCTTTTQLATDYHQGLSSAGVYEVINNINNQIDRLWSRSKRLENTPQINQLLQQLVNQKLTSLQQSISETDFPTLIRANNHVGVCQKEFFALHRLSDLSLQKILAELPDQISTKQAYAAIEHQSGVILKNAYICLTKGLEKAMLELVEQFDTQIRPDSANRPNQEILNQITSSIDLANITGTSNWIGQIAESFAKTVNEAANNISVESRSAFLKVFLEAHIQKTGDLSSAWNRNMAVYNLAFQQLNQNRREIPTIESHTAKECFSVINSALNNMIQTVEKIGVGNLREAYDNNRSGVVWKDTRLHQHIAKLAGQRMINKVRPEHLSSTLEALAEYGQKTIELFRSKGLRIESKARFAGLEDFPQSTKQSKLSSSCARETFKPRRKIPDPLVRSGAYQALLNYKNSLANSLFSPEENKVYLSDINSSNMLYTVGHELGHALDHNISNQHRGYKETYFSQKDAKLQNEFLRVVASHSGATTYSEADIQEFFAESCAISQNAPGFFGSYVQPYADIYTLENLKDKHPNIAQFLEEVKRAPDMVLRAASEIN